MTRRVAFTEEAGRRIVAATRAVERGNRNASPIKFRQVSDGDVLRLCRTTCAFDKGTVQTLDVWEDGTPPSETISTGITIPDVVNKFANIEANAFVSVALHGNGRWYVVAAECSPSAGS